MKSNFFYFQEHYKMKKQVRILLLIVVPKLLFTQIDIPYQNGERLEYAISFGGILNVGYGDLEIKQQNKLEPEKLYIIGKGKTALFFDLFFKVRDVYITEFNTEKLLPISFIRNVNEGGHLINQKYQFFHEEKLVKTQDSVYKIDSKAQDMLSAFYFARTFDKRNLKKDSSFFVPIFMDDENYMLEIKYLKNEIIKTKWGEINCMVFNPKMQEGRIFQDGEKMNIWISDDDNHIPLKIETEIWAGKIIAELINFSAIKHPFKVIK